MRQIYCRKKRQCSHTERKWLIRKEKFYLPTFNFLKGFKAFRYSHQKLYYVEKLDFLILKFSYDICKGLEAIY